MSAVASRLAAVALALAVLALVAVGAVVPIADRFASLTAAEAELAGQLEAFRERAAAAPARAATIIDEEALFAAPSKMLAAVAVQDQVTEAAAAAGAVVETLRLDGEIASLDSQSVIEEIAVTVELSAGMGELESLLHRIESARPYLIVDRLDARRRREVGDAMDADTVALRLRVFGLRAKSSDE